MGTNEFIRVKVEGISQLEKMRAFLDPKLFHKATRAGILAAATSANKQAGKSISQRYNIGSRRIKQDVSLFTGYASRGEATLTFAARAPTLSQFGFRPGTRATGLPGLGRGRGWGPATKKGRPGRASILRGQRQDYPTTFMAMGRGGVMLPFRVGNKRKPDGKRRLQVVYGPSVARMFDKGEHSQLIQTEINIEINRSFIAGYKRALDSAARGYGGR
jgi:hypothetical protein